MMKWYWRCGWSSCKDYYFWSWIADYKNYGFMWFIRIFGFYLMHISMWEEE